MLIYANIETLRNVQKERITTMSDEKYLESIDLGISEMNRKLGSLIQNITNLTLVMRNKDIPENAIEGDLFVVRDGVFEEVGNTNKE